MKFLGLLNVFAAFVDHFAAKAAAIYQVLQGTGFNKKKYMWATTHPKLDTQMGIVTAEGMDGVERSLEKPQGPGRTNSWGPKNDSDRCQRIWTRRNASTVR